MVRRFALALAAAAFAEGEPAHAQSPPPLRPVAPQAGSLAQLLDNGWSIHSVSGQNGQFLMLQFNGRKWVRCELLGTASVKLRYSPDLVSDCRALN